MGVVGTTVGLHNSCRLPAQFAPQPPVSHATSSEPSQTLELATMMLNAAKPSSLRAAATTSRAGRRVAVVVRAEEGFNAGALLP
jgi:hypothetical protein